MDLKEALEAADAADAASKLCYQEIADKSVVSRSTLSRQHQGICASREEAYLSRRKLSPPQEVELCKYIEGLSDQGLPPTRRMVQNFATEIAHQYVGDSWVTEFLNRHRDTLLYK